nr:hypothetical protein [uncultured Anaerostipes sp.]
MPKFCTKCGSALINGKCPNCDSGQPMGQQGRQPNDSLNQQEHEPHTTNAGRYKEEGKAFFQNLLMIIKNPVDGMRVVSEDRNNKIGLFFMGIEAVLAGLFVFLLFDQIVDNVQSLSSMSDSNMTTDIVCYVLLLCGCLMGMGEDIVTFFSRFNNIDASDIALAKPSMGGYFIREAIVVLAVALIMSGLVYLLMRYWARADINWIQACQLVGLKGIGSSMGWLIAIIAVLLHLYAVALIAILLGAVLGMIYLAVTMAAYPKVNRNPIPYILLVLFVAAVVITNILMNNSLETLNLTRYLMNAL